MKRPWTLIPCLCLAGLLGASHMAHAAPPARRGAVTVRVIKPATKRPTKPVAKIPRKKIKPPPMVMTATYLMQVHNRVQQKWKVKGLSLMELHRRSATLRLWIKPNGQLQRIRIVIASGLAKFDRSLTRAVAAALPLPKPKPRLREWVRYEGVEILFRRRVFKRKRIPLKKTYKSSTVINNWQKPRKPPKRR